VPLMNSFYKHHRDSIRWHYRCFDRILLNGLIQPFQLKDKKIAGVPSMSWTRSRCRSTIRSVPRRRTCWQRRISATSPAAFTLASIGIRSQLPLARRPSSGLARLPALMTEPRRFPCRSFPLSINGELAKLVSPLPTDLIRIAQQAAP
jgi:hypothetical protein